MCAAIAAVATSANICLSDDRVISDDHERPSRTASDGTQVVDYLAELESDVDSLNRQVTALQNELALKNDQLNQEAKTSLQQASPRISDQQVFSEQLDAAQRTIKSQSERLRTAERQNEDQSLRLRQQAERLAEQQERISELLSLVSKHDGTAAGEKFSGRDPKIQLDDQVRELETQRLKISELESQRELLEVKVERYSARENDLKSEVARLQSTVLDEKKRNEKLEEIKKRAGNLIESQSKLDDIIAGQRKLIAERDRCTEELETKVKQQLGAASREIELQTRLDNIQSALLQEQKRNQELVGFEQKATDLTASRSKLDEVIAEQRRLIANRDIYTKELEERIKQQSGALEERIIQLRQLEDRSGVLEVQLADSRSRERDLSGKISTLEGSIIEARSRSEKLPVKRLPGDPAGLIQQTSAKNTGTQRQNQTSPLQVTSIIPRESSEARLRISSGKGSVDEGPFGRAVGGIKGDLTMIRAQYGQREKLFSAYVDSRPAVLVNPTRAVSRRGESIADLENALAKATSEREMARIRQAVEDIKKLLDDDIRLIQRLTRK